MNEVRIVITGDDRSGPAFAAVKRSGEDIEAALDRSSKKTKGLGKDFEGLGAAGTKAGGAVAKSVGDALGAIPAQVKGAGLAIGAGLGVAAAPAIGAAIAGAVVGGVGLGGIAGGVMAASSDPAVEAAMGTFKQSIAKDFAASGQSFVKPVIDSLGILQDGFHGLDLGDQFEKVAPYVTKLAMGLTYLGNSAMPGVSRAFTAAGPALQIITDYLPKLGTALGDAVGDIAESEGALDGLRGILELTSIMIAGTGKLVTILADAYHWLLENVYPVTHAITDFLGATIGAVPIIGAAYKALDSMNDSMGEVTEEGNTAGGVIARVGSEIARTKIETDRLAGANDELVDSWNGVLGKALEMEDAQDAVRTAQNRLNEQMKRQKEGNEEGAGSFDRHTEAGRENARMLRALLDTERDQVRANANAGKSSDGLLAKMRAQATQLGLTAEETEELIGDLKRLSDEIKALKSKRITVGIDYVQTGSLAAGTTSHQQQAMAHGGVVGASASSQPAATGGVRSGPIRMNEQGIEGIHVPTGSTIIPHGQTMQMLSQAASSGGNYDVVQLVAGDALMAAFVERIQNYVRGAGGDGRTLGIVRVRG